MPPAFARTTMPLQEYASDAVHKYISEMTFRIVAQSGIPSDRFHLGKILLQKFKDAPDFILNIDGATGETVTFESALRKSVQCANAFRKMGLKRHDIIILMAPNHVDLPIPMYAGLYIGVPFKGIDRTSKIDELADIYKNTLPKIIFCQNEKADDVQEALMKINHESLIITFDKSDRFMTFSDLLKKGNDVPVEDFKTSDFDSETTIAVLIPTSGTTGLSKSAAASHKNWISGIPNGWMNYNNFPTPFKMSLSLSPVQWVSATSLFVFGPIIQFTLLHSSFPMTVEHFCDLVNKYRPSSTAGSPNFFMQVFQSDISKKCDLTCFEFIIIGGSAVPNSLLDNIKMHSPNTKVNIAYGSTEILGLAFNYINSVQNSVGSPLACVQYRLVNPETQEDINEPNVPGELWIKSDSVFMGYYNNPKATEQTLTKDGWLKTGDILYRDEKWNFFFIERLKMMLKYMGSQISPIELEKIILKHPGVYDVAVTGIPDKAGDLPVACIVCKEGSVVTAEEIKNMVKESLADSKQLRGGVIFMKELPITASHKINRAKLAKMVIDMKRL